MASVRASIRVSISWEGGEPFEDTETLVFTIDGFSLDLRVFNTGQQVGEVDWSTVAVVTETDDSTSENPKLRWDHIIDSRPPTDMPDQGAFATLSNGDVSETGTMFNPKTARYQDYVEVWRRLPTERGMPYCVLERVEPEESGDKAFLGRVGSRALGMSKAASGLYSAFRESTVDGKTERLFDAGEARSLPSVPWDESVCTGQLVELGGRQWVVRIAGVL